MKRVTTPAEFFGVEPGDESVLLHWFDLVRYYRLLETQSDRLRVQTLGPTTDGNEFIALYLSAPENLERLDEYRQISRRIANPRGEDDWTALCERGKPFCLISCSLHAHENGGAQMAPLLVHELVSAEDPDALALLQNVIAVIVPSASPDGQIAQAEWNRRYHTECPLEIHRYGGHGNNRDFISENLVETRHLNRLLHRDQTVSAMIDFHHTPWDYPRMIIDPSCDPLYGELPPLLVREMSLYGTEIACELEREDIPDIVCNYTETEDTFTHYGFFSFHNAAKLHNIIGLLSESAHVPVAQSLYIEPESCSHKGMLPCVANPHPWRGGTWTLAMIMRQQRLAALALLRAVARDKNRVLRNMALMALRQTERGQASEEQAYLVPADQYDPSSARRFLDILAAQGVELRSLAHAVTLPGGMVCPAGSAVVPLAQPKYALIQALCRKGPYPDNRYTRRPNSAYIITDVAAPDIAEWMGVTAEPAGMPLPASALAPYSPWAEAEMRLPLSGRENVHYRYVNQMLAQGLPVRRREDGGFAAEGRPLCAARLGLLVFRRASGDAGPYTQLTLQKFGFPYRLLRGEDIRAGTLEELDTLILPGYGSGGLLAEDADDPAVPEEARYAMGKLGAQQIMAFVQGGGRLIAWQNACQYVMDLFELPMENVMRDTKAVTPAYISSPEYCTRGSVLRVRLAKDALMLGCPEHIRIVHDNGPVFAMNATQKAADCASVARFEPSDILSSGVAVGEARMRGQTCLMRARIGRGEALLYGFDPQFRSQTDGTFKLLFNALYRE